MTHRLQATTSQRSIACIGLATLALFPASFASADLTDDVDTLISMNVSGGVTGFRLRRGDGVVLANKNPDYVAYPASAIKVVCHLHAMRVVEEPNLINLNTLIPVYLNSDDSCDDNHDGQLVSWEPLDDVLREMMEDSDNDRTNAVIDYFDLFSIDVTMHNIVGMSPATLLVNKMGSPCGGPNQVPPNSFTLRDIHRAYEKVAAGEIFALESTRDTYYDLMLNGTSWIMNLVNEEAPADLDPDDLDDFKAGIELARKGGSWSDDIRTLAGWIKLPGTPCHTVGDRHYAFSVFFDQVNFIAPDFTTKTVVDAMLRDEMRAALEDWSDCLNPPCSADIDGNNAVEFGDLVRLLANWGTCDSTSACLSDIDSDGNVGFSDVIELLYNWGPCG